jgi:outer membrane lipoprotein SlyB
MTKAVFGLANNDEQARRIVDHLLSSGFSNEDISILYPDRNKNKIRTNERGEMAYEDRSNQRNDYGDTTHQKTMKKGSLSTEKHSKAPEGGVTGAAAGGLLGGSLGLLAGIGALAIPGLGPFIAAGPIMAALSGSAVGGSVGLLLGALVGSGIPEYEAKKYEAGLKQGNILISVHTDDSNEMHRAEEMMKKDGAKDISSSKEKVKSR